MKNMRKNGTVTIELSLIMPGIMAVIIFILFVSFYMHDITLIEKASYVSVNYMANTSDNVEEILQTYFDEVLEHELLGDWNISRISSYEGDEVILNVNGCMNEDGSLFFGYINEQLFSYETKVCAINMNEVNYLRGIVIEQQNRTQYR